MASAPALGQAQAKPTSPRPQSIGPVQASQDTVTYGQKVRDTVEKRFKTAPALRRDSLRLLASDSSAASDLWLGYQYEAVGRRKDAESAYLRVLPIASDSVRAYAQTRLQSIWKADRADEFGWIFWPLRPFLLWFSEWRWRAEALLLAAGGILGYLHLRTRRAGKTQLRIQPFTRNLTSSVGLGIEETIADFHQRTNEVGAPLGVLLNSGLKLPVMYTAPNEEFLELVEIVSPQPWIPKIVGRILRGSDNPRFVVTGHATGTMSAIRVVVGLKDGGRRVRSWERTVAPNDLIDCERALACEVVFALSEFPL